MEDTNRPPELQNPMHQHEPQTFVPVDGEPAKDAGTTTTPATSKKTNPLSKLAEVFKGLSFKPKKSGEQKPQGAEQAKPMAIKPKIPVKMLKKVALIGGIIIVLLVVLSIAVRFIPGNGNGGIPIFTTTPAPSIVPTPTVSRPSPYADDPDILSVIEELNALDQLLNEASFREDTLRIPRLDWDVNFGE